MSSTMATLSRNTLSPAGTREPSRASTPTAKAMSVAIGIPQPRGPRRTGVEARNSRAGSDHAAHRGHHRQGRPARRSRSSPDDQLALDLQADHEEEQRHQPVVDPVPQIQGQGPAARPRRPARSPTGLIGSDSRVSWPTPAPRRRRRAGPGRRRPRCPGTPAGERPGDGRPGSAQRSRNPPRVDDESARESSRSAGISCLPTRLPGAPATTVPEAASRLSECHRRHSAGAEVKTADVIAIPSWRCPCETS